MTHTTSMHDATAAQARAATALLGGALGLVAIAAGASMLRRPGRTARTSTTALQSYLLDHLTGSDAARGLVDRLRQTHGGTSVGALAERLHVEFGEERRVVIALLHALGASPRSIKRVAGKAASAAAGLVEPALTSRRPVFLALESLAIGVQGKRLLWRALDGLPLEGPWMFRRLEEQALRQWEDIEALRLVFARAVLGNRTSAPASR